MAHAAAKPNANRENIGGAVQRVLKAGKGANGYAAWVGPAGHALLSLIGATT